MTFDQWMKISQAQASQLLRDAWIVAREAACAEIKAANDKVSESGGMLGSDDCISVIRGTWRI